ncbi:MAG TPA: response regulator transcription factor [Thermoanaerobaculia bacterium]|nr:response regulator transcription factor [Thermoanaerobaculia bacterium]
MSATILVVEDDPSLLAGLALNLRKSGYRIRTAADGAAALASLESERPDLVLLDLMLPGVDGLEILSRIRTTDASLPVVVLTALGSEDEKIRGLDVGANDYVTKPFSVAELLARVRAALRARAAAAHDPPHRTLRAGPIELDRDSRRVAVADEPVELTTREFEVLEYLLLRPERVLTREQILAAVWDQTYGGTDRTVDNVISSLRQKLGEHPRRPRHLQTVRSVGYRLVP